MPKRAALVRALAMLDRSFLPMSDPVRLDLESELIDLIAEAERREREPASGVEQWWSTVAPRRDLV